MKIGNASNISDRPDTPLSEVGTERLERFRSGKHISRLRELIKQDKAVSEELEDIKLVEKLILYQKWMLELVNNYVSVPFLYDPNRRSMFEKGTLVMDGRRFDLNVLVQDPSEHKKVARESSIFLLYLEINREGEESFEIATAVTSGTRGSLFKGKRGVFFTKDGRAWHAQVKDIVENPISLWEAIKDPFKQIGATIKQKIEGFKEQQFERVESTVTGEKSPTKTDSSSSTDKGVTSSWIRDLLTGGGIAVAALGSSGAYMLSKLQDISWFHVAAVLGGAFLLFMIPLSILAYLKLRHRDAAPLLEASGWAINTRMRLSRSLCKLFTRSPSLPSSAQLDKTDLAKVYLASMESESRRWSIVFLLLLIAVVLTVITLYFSGYWKVLFL
ncbi:MAG: hypothetical protein ABEJ65_07410 [bacterium]